MKQLRLWLIFGIFVGVALRIYDLLNIPAIEIDGISYAQIADHFSKGAFSEGLRNAFPPFYPAIISLFHLIVSDVELAGRLVSLVCGVLLIYGTYLGLTRFVSREKALWGAFFIAVHPYLTRYSAQVLSESLATFLFGATVFFFYVGCNEKSGWRIALSGFLLTLTYLTRPEYIVYYFPLAAFLLHRRRLSHTAALILPFILLGLGYILYMRVSTGFWVVSGKAIHSPFVPLLSAAINVPAVAFHFFAALFVPFVLLLIVGFLRVERSYRALAILLSAFHVLSLACVGHSTRRYSVEFVPLLIIFMVEGWYVVEAYTHRFRHGRAVWFSAAVIICLLTFSQGIEGPHRGRDLFKKAGLFLVQYDRGANVASRLPLASFYGKGTWTDVSATCTHMAECPGFTRVLEARGAGYLVLDDKMASECPWLSGCVAAFPMVASFSDTEDFVKIYRVPSSGSSPQ
jgi:4-amino-4-deoxy-L-arabinose transferase-like glycosyltransferase